MQRIQADDVDAFAELNDRYSARAFGLARAICGSSHRADDAVQEGFLAVWRSRGSFDLARSSARAWLFTVISHRSLDLMRRKRRDDDRRHSSDALDSSRRSAQSSRTPKHTPKPPGFAARCSSSPSPSVR